MTAPPLEGKMLHRQGFTSIFNDENYSAIEQSKKTDSPQWKISDCSESDDENDGPANRSKQIKSSEKLLEIQNDTCCSVEKIDVVEISNKIIKNLNNLHCTTHKEKRYKVQMRQSSERKKSLPSLVVKRKSFDGVSGNSPRKILGSSNSSLLQSTNSPWGKVKNVFTPLKRNMINHQSVNAGMIDEIQIESEKEHTDAVCSVSHSTIPPIIETYTLQPQATLTAPPSELDLLVALIERENNPAPQQQSVVKRKNKTKRSRKGGFLRQLERTLKTAKANRRFLKHDKHFSSGNGSKLQVLSLEIAFNVFMAIVKPLDVNGEDNSFRIVLDPEMEKLLKVGSKLEAFFDPTIEPYMLTVVEGENLKKEIIYVQPHKLLLL